MTVIRCAVQFEASSPNALPNPHPNLDPRGAATATATATATPTPADSPHPPNSPAPCQADSAWQVLGLVLFWANAAVILELLVTWCAIAAEKVKEMANESTEDWLDGHMLDDGGTAGRAGSLNSMDSRSGKCF